MKKIITIVALLAVLLFIPGCGEETQSQYSGGYIGGTDGLSMNYATNSPPAKVLDNQQESFSIIVELENLGEYTVQAGEVIATLTGINYDSYAITEPVLTNFAAIEEVSTTSAGEKIDGGVSADIAYEATFMSDLPVDQDQSIVTNICYRYKTEATSSLCLRNDVTGRGEDSDVCAVTDELTAANSGGPIQVTGMNENRAGKNTILLNLKIENSGSGNVYAPEGLGVGICSETGTDLKDYKNKVHVMLKLDDTFQEGIISCGKFMGTDSGYVNMVGGESSTLSCTIDTSTMAAATFNSPVYVFLDYMYKESITQGITIQNV